jgi:hypothetical protein
LRELPVAAPHVSMPRGLRFLAGSEVVALLHLLDPAIEPLDHAVDLGMLRGGQTVFDAGVGAELIELVPASGAVTLRSTGWAGFATHPARHTAQDRG